MKWLPGTHHGLQKSVILIMAINMSLLKNLRIIVRAHVSRARLTVCKCELFTRKTFLNQFGSGNEKH
jgi:hypothetical protein